MTDEFKQVELDDWTDEEDEELRRLLEKRLSVRRSSDHDLKFMANAKYMSDILEGEGSEQRLAQILNGNVEVKTHRSVNHYKNVFVEVTDRGRPSGVMTSKAEWQAQVFEGEGYNGEVIVLIKTNRLKRITEKHWYVKGGDASMGAKVNRNSLLLSDEEIDKLKG